MSATERYIEVSCRGCGFVMATETPQDNLCSSCKRSEKERESLMESQSLAVLPRPEFTPEEIQLLKDTVCKGATDAELKLFAHVCERTGLNPFAKQIHALKRKANDERGNWKETISFQTGIDGYRLIAQRTKLYEGQTDPEWCGKDGAWKDVWLLDDPPAAARVGVYRKGCQQPMRAVALYREYVQTNADGKPNRMWATMPANQLAKCAESLALRKAFPQELSGLYTYEEMGQSENEAPPRLLSVAARTVEPEDESQEPPNSEEDVEEMLPGPPVYSPAVSLKAFEAIGVSKAQLEAFLQRDLSPGVVIPDEDRIALRRIYDELKAGRTDWATVMKVKNDLLREHATA